MPTSDKQLDAKLKKVQDMREKVSASRQEADAAEAELANDVTIRQLEAEEAALQVQLDEQNERISKVKDGGSLPVVEAEEPPAPSQAADAASKKGN